MDRHRGNDFTMSNNRSWSSCSKGCFSKHGVGGIPAKEIASKNDSYNYRGEKIPLLY